MFIKREKELKEDKKKRVKNNKSFKSFVSIFNKADIDDGSNLSSKNTIKIAENNILNKKDEQSPPNESSELNLDIIDGNLNEISNINMEKKMDNTEQSNGFAKAIEDGFNKLASLLTSQAKSESENENEVLAQVKSVLAEKESLVTNLQAQLETLTSEKETVEAKVSELEAKIKADTDAIAEKEEELIKANYIAKAKDEFSNLVGTPEEIASKLRTIDSIQDEATKATVLEALKSVAKSNENLTKEQGFEGNNNLTNEELVEKKIYAKAEELFIADGNKLSMEQCVIKAEQLLEKE